MERAEAVEVEAEEAEAVGGEPGKPRSDIHRLIRQRRSRFWRPNRAPSH